MSARWSSASDDGQPVGASLSQDTSVETYVSLPEDPWEPVARLPARPPSPLEAARRKRRATEDAAFTEEVLSAETVDAHAGGTDGGETAAYRPQLVLATLVSYAPRTRVDGGERRQPPRPAPAPRRRSAKRAKRTYPPLPLTKATLVDLTSPSSRRRRPVVAAARLPPQPRLEDVPSTQESIDDDWSHTATRPSGRQSYSSMES